MPEYLAPGVYVEETSFRAKSIEGVGTSTTGFAGPTRKGPIGGPLELVTSLGDFEHMYGSLNDLSYGTNYLAHSVRAFFNEGGSRLYVSRVFLAGADAGFARSAPVVTGTNGAEAEQVRFVARFPGSAGNGTMILQPTTAAATGRSMAAARDGTMLRVGGGDVATPARLQGGLAPFSLPEGGTLRLVVNGANADITFHGAAAEVMGSTVLADPVDLADGNTSLQVTIDGIVQTLTLPVAPTPRGEFILALNRQIRGGYVRLSEAGDGGATGRLVIGSDRRGRLSSVAVQANAELGFAAAASAIGSANNANNVGDLGRVTADEINVLLQATNQPVRASLGVNGRIVFTTVGPGAAASLAVGALAGSTHAELGLPEPGGDPVTGADGATVRYYVKNDNAWLDADNAVLDVSNLDPGAAPDGKADFLTLTVIATDADGESLTYDDLGFDRRHPRWIGHVLTANPARRSDALANMYAIGIGTGVSTFELRAGLLPADEDRLISFSGGNDGVEPTTRAYETALEALRQIEDIAIVAAPGSSAYADAQGIQGALIAHAESRRAYRIAVLDTAPKLTNSEAQLERGRIDSKDAALYYPWVTISNPLARPGFESIPREIDLPPSGLIAGIYARNDVEHGVHKAPANEVVRSALRFESDINFAEQEILNPLGINCLRYLTGRGYRVWGARTATSDPEWKYANVSRYFKYLERSIDVGTQWAVFENNGPRLWQNVRDTVSAFLYNEFRNNALLGANEQEAFFVRCDRSTMTQNDLDNGRLVCLIGVAVLKPAEFVIFRIGQKTADARS